MGQKKRQASRRIERENQKWTCEEFIFRERAESTQGSFQAEEKKKKTKKKIRKRGAGGFWSDELHASAQKDSDGDEPLGASAMLILFFCHLDRGKCIESMDFQDTVFVFVTSYYTRKGEIKRSPVQRVNHSRYTQNKAQLHNHSIYPIVYTNNMIQ